MPVWTYTCMECGREKREWAHGPQLGRSRILCLDCSKAIVDDFFSFSSAVSIARFWETLRASDIRWRRNGQ